MLNETNAVLPNLIPFALNSELNTIVLTPLEVESVLKTLIIGKASGLNGLSNRILKELSSQLCTPFCSLFNQSLRTDYLPACYKEANVCPVPKKGDLSIVSNHRPISLLNVEAKVLRGLFSNTYLITFAIIIYYHHCNLALYRVIQRLINQHSFIILSVKLLIPVKRLGLSSVISAKHSIVYGMLSLA